MVAVKVVAFLTLSLRYQTNVKDISFGCQSNYILLNNNFDSSHVFSQHEYPD